MPRATPWGSVVVPCFRSAVVMSAIRARHEDGAAGARGGPHVSLPALCSSRWRSPSLFALPVSHGPGRFAAAPERQHRRRLERELLRGDRSMARSTRAGRKPTMSFQYGPTRSYGSQTPLSPAGNGTKTIKVSQSVSGLQPLTTYHYRIVATSPAGTTKGNDRTFTTPEIPTVGGHRRRARTRSCYRRLLRGRGHRCPGPGSGNHEIVLQANPIPLSGAASRRSATRSSRTPSGASRSRSSACWKARSCVS